ncbi:DUF2933 domain-containing protein [Tropicimonas sp. IMCC6043]|uniref:DUF2933 domain-containing protein n=1 Tax=Tropicimonas sp. IMCC6043 TaxID=2510645 RepID=UPI00101C33D6|nr:DUF2933 domain-containing protein [Tropicimonas sp. IMCC6043]RYH06463.1 DUF2933 domain-containing protein [Tropicimonas sp. IMCC6043]
MAHHLTQAKEDRKHVEARSGWPSPNRLLLIAAFAVAALLLGIEFKEEILNSNMFAWAPLLLCLGMHFFMRGGHGSGEDKS